MGKGTATVETIKRRISVCVKNGCTQCRYDTVKVPEDCEYAILHLFEVKAEIGCRPRQSGKTTQLMELAMELADRGDTVYYITHRMEATNILARQARQHLDPNTPGNIMFLSKGNVENQLRGRPGGPVVLDEVRPDEIKRLANPMFPVVAALWT